MKVYCLFYVDYEDCDSIEYLQKIYSTKDKADMVLHNIFEDEKKRLLEEAKRIESKLNDPNFGFRYYLGREAVEQNMIFLKEKAKNMTIKDLDYVIREYEVE